MSPLTSQAKHINALSSLLTDADAFLSEWNGHFIERHPLPDGTLLAP
jgi:hypothetical protein